MLKKRIAFVLAFVMLMMSFAGCSTEQEQSSDTSLASQATGTTEASQAAEALYTAGVYTAQVQGFGGLVTVSVTVDESSILSVEITGDSETEGVGSRAVDALPEAIVEAQSSEVEAVSGATVTSNAICEAAQSALNEAAGVSVDTTTNNMTDGTYTVTVESFFFAALETEGFMTMDVTVKDNKITDIDVHDYSDTPAIGGLAFDQLSEQVTASQSLNVDSVSGATVSSNAYKNALEQALTESGANIAALKAVTVEKRAAEQVSYDTQVVVIGAGMAGLSAAHEAADQGLDVILVEKQDVLGSSTSRSEGYVMATETELQQENGIEDSVENFIADIDSLYDVEPLYESELMGKAIENSSDLITFLEENGVVFEGLERVDVTAPRDIMRTHCAEGKGGGLSNALYQSLSKKGVRILMGTPCTEILMENGVVVGASCTNTYGDEITINAEAVILCAGSYAGDKEVFEEIQPETNGEAFYGYGSGDGYYLAQATGADMLYLSYPQLQYNFYTPNMTVSPSVKPGSATKPVADVLLLDDNGQRVVSEEAFCFEYSSRLWDNGKADQGWCLVGDDFAAQYPDVIELGLTTMTTNDEPMAYEASSVEELAAQAGLDAQTLKSELDRYNELCDKGVDEDFGKDAQYMTKIEGTLYLLRLPQIITDGYSGCKINEFAQVIDANGDVIPGFYAAGSCAVAQMSGANYNGCGTSLLISGTYGRFAAQHAASIILEQ